MESSKKVLLTTIFIAILVVLASGITFAFFNYTRTGTANVVRVGRIYFNSEQGNTINLENVFPIDKANIDNETDYVGSVTINIIGDTTYTDGIEYVVSAVNVNNSIGSGWSAKVLPLSVDVSYEASENKVIGIEDEDYFTNRGGNSSIYKVLAGRTIKDNDKLLVGYIKPDETGIDGTITLTAYIDKDKIAISDTYPSGTNYKLNPNMTEEALNRCKNIVQNRFYSQTSETIEAYCLGTGTIYGSTIEDHLNVGYYYDSQIRTFLNYNVCFPYENGTTSEWAQSRKILTTEEWNSFQENGVSFQIKVEANEGTWVDQPVNSMYEMPSIDYNVRSSIKEIRFDSMNKSTMYQRYDAATYKADATYNNEGEVLAWLEPNLEDNTKYTMYIASDGITYLNKGSALFYYFNYPEKIIFNNVNTSRVTDMSDMFYGCQYLTELDLSSFDTSNVTNMAYLVGRNYALERIDMSGLDLRKVQSMNYMFVSCSSLEEIDFTGSYTRDLEYMNNMFEGVDKLEYLDLSNFGGDNLYSLDTTFAFGMATCLKTLIMRNFNFGSISYPSFGNFQKLETIDFTGANFSNMSGVPNFNNSPLLTTIIVSTGVDFSGITGSDANQMFSGCTSLVGGSGTTYDSNHIDSSYAHIDGGQSNPGYFTLAN